MVQQLDSVTNPMNHSANSRAAECDYREYAPPRSLADYFLCLWTQSITGCHTEYEQRVLPDGCIDIVFINDEAPIVVGPWVKPFVARLPVATKIVGARWHPGRLLRESETWVLYFSDWKNDPQTMHRATAETLPNFQLRGTALKTDHGVQDVKKFVVNGQSWYLMGLVGSDPKQSIFFSLSNDGITFNSQQVLFRNLSVQDQYIVAVGLVTKGTQLLGVLYGAGPVESLDQNRIFARWLQKKVLITDSSNVQYSPQGGYGPDRQWFQAPQSGSITGTLTVYAEDGVTPLASGSVNVTAGKVYQLVLSGGG